jgi:hypothetical protein
MPSNKAVNVVRRGRPDGGERAKERCVRCSHSTTIRRVESRQPLGHEGGLAVATSTTKTLVALVLALVLV